MSSRLSEALPGHMALRRQVDRLRVLSEHSETILIDRYNEIEPFYNALSHSARALEELAEGIATFAEIEKSISCVPDLIERCRNLAASASMWRGSVLKVLQSCRVIMPTVHLRGVFSRTGLEKERANQTISR